MAFLKAASFGWKRIPYFSRRFF